MSTAKIIVVWIILDNKTNTAQYYADDLLILLIDRNSRIYRNFTIMANQILEHKFRLVILPATMN